MTAYTIAMRDNYSGATLRVVAETEAVAVARAVLRWNEDRSRYPVAYPVQIDALTVAVEHREVQR